jgi:type I restriction enzyme, R subunit
LRRDDYTSSKSASTRTISVASQLHAEVAAMNVDNFVVRPKRRIVERFPKPKVWTSLTAEARSELSHEVAGLPSQVETEPEDAKRFDLLILKLQLARLNARSGFEGLRDQVIAIAEVLDEKSAIPMVREQLALLEELQSEEWWQDVTVPTENGVMEAARLYESPFTAVAPQGPDSLFTAAEVDELLAIIDSPRQSAIAA